MTCASRASRGTIAVGSASRGRCKSERESYGSRRRIGEESVASRIPVKQHGVVAVTVAVAVAVHQERIEQEGGP